MKRLIMIFLTIFVIGQAHSGQSFDQKLPVSPEDSVSIEHVNGDIEIRSWDKSEVWIKGELSDRTKSVTFEKQGNEIVFVVKVKNSSGWSWNSDEKDDLQVFVPTAIDLSYESVNASAQVSGIEGRINLETVNGKIQASDLAGRIRIESVNGKIETNSLAGEVRIETVNGKIKANHSDTVKERFESINGSIDVTSASKEVNVELVNGDVLLNLQTVNRLKIETVNGDVEAQLNLADDGEVEVGSVGGELDFNFQPSVSAKVDVQVHAGDKITNELSEARPVKAKYGPSSHLTTSVNGGNGLIKITTVNGRVSLGKR